MNNYFYTDFYITQAITEHGKLNSYLKRFNIKDSDLCEICDSIDDIKHTIFDCVRYEEERELMMSKIEGSHDRRLQLKELLHSKNFIYFKEYCFHLFN